MTALLLCAALAATAPPFAYTASETRGVAFETVEFRGHACDIVRVRLDEADLRLYWNKPDGERYGAFAALREGLASEGLALRFATNAGIFTPEFAPAGLHIEKGEELRKLNTLDEGYGNFHLMPNGVFYIDDEGAHAVTTEAYEAANAAPRLATQSGPMLVIDGELHGAFTEGSDNIRRRSGVGVVSANEVVFAISKLPINFYDFAALFRDELKCEDALYLDGDISLFYAPEAGKSFEGGIFAGMFAVVEPMPDAPAESPGP